MNQISDKLCWFIRKTARKTTRNLTVYSVHRPVLELGISK
jgi:hypothetical protein